jgi:hypothetical protein
MSDKLAHTVRHSNTRESVRLSARQLLNRALVIVAHVFAECGLFVKFGHLPLGAVLVFYVVGALVPVLEKWHDSGIVLHGHEAGVCVCAIEAVGVVLRLLRVPGVEGHGDAVFGLDIPVVQHPFYRQMHEAEGGICVKEDDELVVLDLVRKSRRFYPCRVAVFKIVRVYKFVVVAVYQGVCVVVEDAARDVVDLAPVVFAVLEGLGGLQRPRIQIQNQHILTQILVVACVLRQRVFYSILVDEFVLIDANFERCEERPDDVFDWYGGLAALAIRCRRPV